MSDVGSPKHPGALLQQRDTLARTVLDLRQQVAALVAVAVELAPSLDALYEEPEGGWCTECDTPLTRIEQGVVTYMPHTAACIVTRFREALAAVVRA